MRKSTFVTFLVAFIVVAAVIGFSAWVTMLVAGAVFAKHNWYTPGFWEVLGVGYLISWAGGLWNQTVRTIAKK